MQCEPAEQGRLHSYYAGLPGTDQIPDPCQCGAAPLPAGRPQHQGQPGEGLGVKGLVGDEVMKTDAA